MQKELSWGVLGRSTKEEALDTLERLCLWAGSNAVVLEEAADRKQMESPHLWNICIYRVTSRIWLKTASKVWPLFSPQTLNIINISGSSHENRNHTRSSSLLRPPTTTQLKLTSDWLFWGWGGSNAVRWAGINGILGNCRKTSQISWFKIFFFFGKCSQ